MNFDTGVLVQGIQITFDVKPLHGIDEIENLVSLTIQVHQHTL